MGVYEPHDDPASRRRSAHRSAKIVAAALVAAFVFSPVPNGPRSASAGAGVYRAFSDSSEWNRPIPKDAPIDEESGRIIAEIQTYSNGGYPRLSIGSWSEPVYFSDADDPIYTVDPWRYGPTVVGVHIPRGAGPAPTSDGQMTVFDRPRGSSSSSTARPIWPLPIRGRRAAPASTTWRRTDWTARSPTPIVPAR
jgi:hypothetical protein